MISNNIGDLDMHVEVDDVFNGDANAIEDLQPAQDKLSKRRQVEDLLEKKRLREELEDFYP